MQCQGVQQKGKQSRGVYRIRRCKNEGLQPLMALKSINIPGIIQVQRGQFAILCAHCYLTATREQ